MISLIGFYIQHRRLNLRIERMVGELRTDHLLLIPFPAMRAISRSVDTYKSTTTFQIFPKRLPLLFL